MIAVEAALMEELKMMGVCDSYWFIYVKPEIRRERLRISRGYSEEKMGRCFCIPACDPFLLMGAMC